MPQSVLNRPAAMAVITGCILAVAGCKKQQETVPHPSIPPGMMGDPHAGVQMQQTPQSEPAPVVNGVVSIDRLTANLPDGWASVPPASSMRKAEFSLTAVEGDREPGIVTAFYFGPSAGGVEPNLQRWYNQFEQPAGRPTSEVVHREEFEAGGMKVIFVHFTGTISPQAMPGAPATERQENWMNVSAIVLTPEGPYFFKGTGPEKTMRSHMDRFKGFLGTLAYHGSPH